MADATRVLVPASQADRVREELGRRGTAVELVVYDEDRRGPFPGAEVFFNAWPSAVRKEALAAAPDVRWIHTASAGVDGLVPVAAERGLVLTESGACYRAPIGEFVLGQMLLVVKRSGLFWDRQRAGVWKGARLGELLGKTCGIVGLGPIGLGVAERAAACGMRIVGCRASGRPIENVTDVVGPDGLGRLYAESDFVVVACPLTSATRGLLGAEAFRQMKPTAVVVNIARGAIIRTDDLVAALRAGEISGACLDVTDPEPLPEGHPLWTLPGVVITPHCAGGGDPALFERIVGRFVDNLERYLAGETLEGLVDPAREY